MKAWEIAKDVYESANAKLVDDSESTWTMDDMQNHDFNKLKIIWRSVAPGSGAPSSLIAGAVQSVENMGMNVEKAERLLQEGYKAYDRDDIMELFKISSKIFYELSHGEKDAKSDYWSYKIYNSWDEFEKSANFPEKKMVDIDSLDFREKVLYGWLGQICGGAFGTALEGYSGKAIKEAFGYVDFYLKPPCTYNDDITYELVFLKTLLDEGKGVNSKAIAENWVAMIPFGWSAEDIAMKNLMLGIYPPESGFSNNPYREWIGAQMRGAVCGMVAPGDVYTAAKLAWIDGEVSHHNNGIIGEVFNSILTSLAFVEDDIKNILEKAIAILPEDSQYYYVVNFALSQCKKYDDWEKVLEICLEEFKEYNLTHAYPNAAIEVVALWFGEGNFDKTMLIGARAGLDVDCNTAQIGNIVGVLNGKNGIGGKWINPIGKDIKTYVRGLEELSIDEIVEWTVKCNRILN